MTEASTSTKSGLARYLTNQTDFLNPKSPTSPLPALYADLSRQRKTNPAGFRSNIEWWRNMLLDVTFKGVQYEFDPPCPISASASASDVDVDTEKPKSGGGGDEVDRTVFRLDESTKARWTVDGVGRPLGLGTVILELEKDFSLVSLDTFLRSTTPILGPASLRGKEAGGLRDYIPRVGDVSWTWITRPLQWAASSLLSSVIDIDHGEDNDGEYSQDERMFKQKKGDWVWIQLVHLLGTKYLDQHYSESSSNFSALSNLLTLTEFQENLNVVCNQQFGFKPSQRDTNLVLKHLVRDRGGIAIFQGGLLKLASSQDHDAVAKPINQQDLEIFTVKQTLGKLERQIDCLEFQISIQNQRIKTYVSKNRKVQALSYLGFRKSLEQDLQKRMGTRDNLKQVILKIEQAQTDIEIMLAYKSSNEVLKTILSEKEIKVENVEKVMDEIEKGIQDVDDLNDLIRNHGYDLDHDELQFELSELERENKAEEDNKIKLNDQMKNKQRQKQQEDQLKESLQNLSLLNTPPDDSISTEKQANNQKDLLNQLEQSSQHSSKQAIAQ